eukprot:scaffold89223_cov79-Phaeocystis_antarctica.AAC.1
MAVVSRGTRAGQVQPAVAGRTRERLPASPAPHKGPPTLPRVRKTRDVWDMGGGEYSRTLSASSTQGRGIFAQAHPWSAHQSHPIAQDTF